MRQHSNINVVTNVHPAVPNKSSVGEKHRNSHCDFVDAADATESVGFPVVTLPLDIGAFVGSAVGFEEGIAVGVSVGPSLGSPLGASLGAVLGLSVGLSVGTSVGSLVGWSVGSVVGFCVGSTDGVEVGMSVGFVVGSDVGFAVGESVDGDGEGLLVVGELEGRRGGLPGSVGWVPWVLTESVWI